MGNTYWVYILAGKKNGTLYVALPTVLNDACGSTRAALQTGSRNGIA